MSRSTRKKSREATLARLGAAAALPALVLSAPVAVATPAEEVDAGRLEEVVVTAQKRRERILDVPVSVAAFDGDVLRNAQVLGIRDLQTVSPNLIVSQSTDRASGFFFMRGIGTAIQDRGFEQSVGVYIDGVYRGRAGAALVDLMDVDRIEVLRGPQSTLFGRNNIGGVINVVTRLPEFETGGSADLTVGNYDNLQVRGSVTGPINDRVAYRLAVQHASRSGFLENLTPGRPDVDSTNGQGIRGQLLFRLSDKGTIRLSGDYSWADDECCGATFRFMSNAFLNGQFAGGTLPGVGTPGTAYPNNTPGLYFDAFDRKVAIGNRNRTDMEDGGISLEANYDLGDSALTVIASRRVFDLLVDQDVDYTDSPRFNVQAVVQNSFPENTFEVRLASTTDTAVEWMVGAYYFDQKLYERLAVSLAPTDGITNQETTSVSAFGQLTYRLTDAFSLTGGVRYLTEQKESSTVGLTPATRSVVATLDDTAWMGNVTAEYRFSEDFNTYVKYSRGYKSGAIPLNISSAAQQANPTLKPETADVIEAGAKLLALDGRLGFNVAVFDQTVKDVQVQSRVGDTLTYIFQNAAEVGTWGIEAELNFRPISQFLVSAGIVYMDAEYESFPGAPPPTGSPGVVVQNLTGEAPWRSPELTFTGIGTWEQPISDRLNLLGRLGWRYASSYTTDLANSPWFENPSTTLIDASIELNSGEGGWGVMVWGKNLTDEEYIRQGSVTVSGAGSHAFYLADPRTYGVTVRKSF